VRKQIIWSVLRALCGYEVRIARRPHEARVFNRHVCSVQALVTWRPMSRLMTVGHSKSPRGCVRYIPSEHMFILVTSPTCPAIFGRNPRREPETARPYSPTLPGFRVLGFVGAGGVNHSINESLSQSDVSEGYLTREEGDATACLQIEKKKSSPNDLATLEPE